MKPRYRMRWRKRTQWVRFAQNLSRASCYRLPGRIGDEDCEFVYSCSLMAKLHAYCEVWNLRPPVVVRSVSVITRECRLALNAFKDVALKDDLVIEPVEASLEFGPSPQMLYVMVVAAPKLVLMCLESEAPVDDCYWVDRLLNTVTLRQTLEAGGGEGAGDGRFPS